jgi:hypothetical protein
MSILFSMKCTRGVLLTFAIRNPVWIEYCQMGHSDREEMGVHRTVRIEAISIISQLIVDRVRFAFLQEKDLRGGVFYFPIC